MNKKGYFGRNDLSEQIFNSIENSKYELPLKKSEIDEIIKQAKKYSIKYKNLNEKNKDKYYRFKIISKILDDFYTCSKKTQELIALGLVGLMNIETKYIKMYSSHQWIDNEKELETFGWEDDIYLCTGDDWDWNPDKERELEEDELFEDSYPHDEIKLESRSLDHCINIELCKYSSIYSKSYYDEDYYHSFSYRKRKTKQKEPKYTSKADAFNKLSLLIEKEFSSISSHNNSKELKHNKMIISLYKKLQQEIYKQELRELIRADICFCNTYTQEIVKDVTYLYSEDIFELNGDEFYDVLKMLEDEFELYLKEKEKYESKKN